MLPGKSPHTEKPRGLEQDPYLWSSQSEGLSAGQRHGGWPLRGPSHVLGDRWGQMSSGLAQCSSQVSDLLGTISPRAGPSPTVLRFQVTTWLRHLASGPQLAGALAATPMTCGAPSYSSEHQSTFPLGPGPRGTGGRPPGLLGHPWGNTLTSCCSVLVATELGGIASGFAACVSCSLAELACENEETRWERKTPYPAALGLQLRALRLESAFAGDLRSQHRSQACDIWSWTHLTRQLA